MEIQGLNSELNEMLMRGQLSGKKIADLVMLKEFVDKLATTSYVAGKEVAQLKKKFGVEPAIQSWGDYFQTELASQYHNLPNHEFEKIVETVKFDIISAIKIFTGKNKNFINAVQENGLIVYGMNKTDWEQKEEEAAHLYIMLQYFNDMGLSKEKLDSKDDEWFDLFIKGSTIKQAI